MKRLTIIFLNILILSSCGQTGPLVLPETKALDKQETAGAIPSDSVSTRATNS